MRIILGIDPGSRFTGYGLLKVTDNHTQALASGVIAIPQKLDLAQKLEFLSDRLDSLMREHQPHEVSVEKNLFR